MRKKGASGFTLIEIVFCLTLVVVILGLSLSALKPGKEKAPTRGLAIALSEEFESAKQLAIRSGHPVALGIPTSGGLGATSVYRAQGWNVPYINWSKGFGGDFPNAAFAAASWAGVAGPGNLVAPPATAKFFNFDQAALLEWLPDSSENDYVYCFLPDGSLISNNLPSSDGRYTLVVAEKATFGGSAPNGVTITSGDNPLTLFISPNGGVEIVTGVPGGNLPAGSGAATTSDAKIRTSPPPGDQQIIRLSNLIVRPNPVNGTPQEGICVPGQYVTLEIWAYSPHGVPLFANWNHSVGSATGQKGIFSYPQGLSSVLTGEADRMEFVPADKIPSSDPSSPNYSPDAPTWLPSVTPPSPGMGLFRAQWSWTVPPISDTDDFYSLTVNVQNATANAIIEGQPAPYKINPEPIPKGRLVVERFSGAPQNIWQLWRMNPDGGGEVLLSPEGIQETMPSIDTFGNKIAFIQGTGAQRRVKVRFLEGGGEEIVSNPANGNYTGACISPNGMWVAYRDNDNNQLRVQRIGSAAAPFSATQTWSGGGHTVKKEKPGWSVDSRYVLFGNDISLQSLDVQNSGSVATFSGSVDTGGGDERCFSPLAYRPTNADGTAGSREYVLFSAGNEDPLIVGFEAGACTPGGAGPNYASTLHGAGNEASFAASPDLNGPAGGMGSGIIDDDFPSFSPDNRRLILTRSPKTSGTEDTADQSVAIFDWDDGAGQFVGPAKEIIEGNVRRAIWVP